MRTLLATVALALATVSTNASAQAIEGTYTAKVSYADLDLSNAFGRAAFAGRVKTAANRICVDLTVSPIDEVHAVADCRSAMFASAKRQIQVASARPSGSVVLAAR